MADDEEPPAATSTDAAPQSAAANANASVAAAPVSCPECASQQQQAQAARKELADKVKHYESKLLTLTVINGALQSENEQLTERLEAADRDPSEAEVELQELKEEFTKRLGAAQKGEAAAREEVLALRAQLSEASVGGNRSAKELEERDAIIEQLTKEGEQLSKTVGKLEAVIMRLRQKEKMTEAELEGATSRVQVLEAALQACEAERDHALAELASQVEAARQDKEATLEAFNEELKVARDKAREQLVSARSRAEYEAKEELARAAARESVLMERLESLQQSFAGTAEKALEREEALRAEVQALEERCRRAEEAHEDRALNENQAMRPLMAQINALTSQLSSQAASMQGTEQRLTQRLREAQEEAERAAQRELAHDKRVQALEGALRVAEAQLVSSRQEAEEQRKAAEAQAAAMQDLTQKLERATARATEAERGEADCNAQLAAALAQKQAADKRASTLEAELGAEVARRQEQLAKVQARDEPRLPPLSIPKASSTTSLAYDAHAESELSREGAAGKGGDARRNSIGGSHGPGGEHCRTPSDAARDDATDVSFTTLDDLDSLVQAASMMNGATGSGHGCTPDKDATSVEKLSAKVRQQAGLLYQMQAAVRMLQTARDHLADASCAAQEKALSLEREIEGLPRLREELDKLQKRHDMALVLIGERNERAEELEADMRDVKALYREQINLLVSQVDPQQWPQGYRICPFCQHCGQLASRGKR